LKTVEGRRSRHDDIDEHLAVWTSQRPKREVEQILQAHRVACGAVLTGTDLLDDPHLGALGYPVPILQQDLGPITLEGPCFKATGMAPPIEAQAPRLGEHTRQICRQLLGMSDVEIDRLVAAGALEVPLPDPV
jgi:crotonobetainyl-CoA:carnitine CoA-transferase CaiB-like acyl-CoA transferase